jgi:hypothetical protein
MAMVKAKKAATKEAHKVKKIAKLVMTELGSFQVEGPSGLFPLALGHLGKGHQQEGISKGEASKDIV